MRELNCYTGSYDRCPRCRILMFYCICETDDDLINDHSMFSKISTSDQSVIKALNKNVIQANEYFTCPFKKNLPRRSFLTLNDDHYIDERRYISTPIKNVATPKLNPKVIEEEPTKIKYLIKYYARALNFKNCSLVSRSLNTKELSQIASMRLVQNNIFLKLDRNN